MKARLRKQKNDKAKVINFCASGFDSVWANYNPIWYTIHGITPIGIGLLRMLAIFGILFGPMWSNFGLKIRQKKLLLSVVLLCSVLIGRTLTFYEVFYGSSFYIAFWTVVYFFFWYGIGPLLNDLMLLYVDNNEKDFAFNKMFCTVGWVTTVFLAGYLITFYGFYAAWYLQFLCVLVGIFSIYFNIPDGKEEEKEEDEKDEDENEDDNQNFSPPNQIDFFSKLNKAINHLNTPVITKLLVVLIVQGAGSIMIQSFLFGFLIYELKAPLYMCGWTVIFATLLEFPIFFYFKDFLEKVGSRNMFLISQVAFIARTYLYTLLNEENYNYILAIEILNSFSYSMLWGASAQFAAEIAPNGLESVYTFCFSFCFHIVGCIVGNTVGGLIFTNFPAAVMFNFFRYLSTVTLIWFCYRCYLENSYPQLYRLNKGLYKNRAEKEDKESNLLEVS